MIGLFLDPVTHDFAIDASKNFKMAKNAEAIGQHVKQRLKTFESEWFLDTTAGVPWMKYVFPRPPSLAIAESIIKIEIAATPGVTAIRSFDMRYDQTLRGLDIVKTEINTIFDEPLEVFL